MDFKKLIYIVLVTGTIVLYGCSTTKEISTHIEESTTIQPITVPIPPVHGDINNIPLTKPDTANHQPFGVYEGQGIIITKDSVTGKPTKATVKIKAKLRIDEKGKPVLDANIETQQSPITTDAKVTNSKTTTDTNTKTEPFLITIWNDIKWWILGLLIICILGVVILKKFFPALIKTYLKI